MKRIVPKILIILLIVSYGVVHAQDRKPDRETETSTTIPALTQFHSVVYQIWHKGWPEKNLALLKDLIPEIEKGVKSLNEAKLPGILHEKAALWKQRVGKLNEITREYVDAAAQNDGNRLLAAAENLHSCFEGLVRVVRPPMEELMEFHKVLYGLYHYDLPERDLQKIGASAKGLKAAMTALDSAAVPGRIQSKAEEFTTRRTRLSASVDALCAAIATGDMEKTAAAVETMHSNYQSLERIFE